VTKKQKKSPSPKKQAKRTIQVKIGGPKRKPTTTTARGGRPGALAALAALSKKVLDESDTPETNLVAALLASSKPIPEISSVPPHSSTSTNVPTTLYTPQLEGIARHLLQEHEPNSMHIQLLNLL
jgi:hypothetical protein